MFKRARGVVKVWIIVGLIFLCIKPVAAQSPKKEVLSILRAIEEKHQVTFSYSPRLLKGLVMSNTDTSLSLEEHLEYISRQVPLSFEKAGDKAILVVPIRSDLTFKVQDSKDGSALELIYILSADSKQSHLISKNGNFILPNAFPTDSLQIRTSFYRPVWLTVSTIEAQNNLITLDQEITDLGEVTVLSYLTTGVNSKLSDHSMEVDMDNLGLIAGETDGDIFQVLQAIPGIRSPNGKPGTLNLRGSPFDQNLTYFDQIPIYHSGHFFGTISPYNPNIVDKVTVQRGVLPARYGGRVGGLINLETSNEIPDSFSGSVLGNSVFAGAQFEIPVIPKRLSLALSARTNYQYDRLSSKLEAYYDLNFQGSQIDPNVTNSGANLDFLNLRFNDINGKLIYDINEKHQASFSFLNIGNTFEYRFNTPNQNRVDAESSELNNWGLTGQWFGQLSDKIDASLSFTKSSLEIFEVRSTFNSNTLSNEESIKNSIDDVRFASSLSFQLSNQTSAQVGYELTDHDLVFTDLRRTPNPEPLDERTSTGQINAFYASLEQRIKDRFIANIGLRSDFYSIRSQSFVDPRISMTYIASKSVFLKASGGKAHQYVKQNLANDFDDFRIATEFWILAENNIPVLESTQLMLGAMVDKSSWLFDLELYSKKIDNVSRPGGNQQSPNNFGSLNIIGADLLVKKRWKAVETWASYTLGHTKASFREEQDAHYDQRHVLNIKLIVPLNRWNIAASWGYMSGLPVYLPDPNQVDNPQALNIAYSGRFPAQHQLDLSTTFRFSNPDAKWKGVIGLSMLNVYDRTNIINAFQQNVRSNNAIRYGLGFSPNLQVKISF